MRRTAFVLGAVALVACSSNGSVSTPPSATPSVSQAPLPPLVGQWETNKDCLALVTGLTQAGLADFIPRIIGETLKIPENAPLPANWDPADPCADARQPYEHSHTFWADREFNSYTQFGEQVDEGRYKLVDDHTFIFPGSIPITMHYRVKGDTIMFDPVIPKNCTSKHCLDVAAWAVSVAMPGQTWTRVTSGPNVPSGTGSS
jgi:hypothetical protein